jgi:hypothetical protein
VKAKRLWKEVSIPIVVTTGASTNRFTGSGKALTFGAEVVWKGARTGNKAAKVGYRVGKKFYRPGIFTHRILSASGKN